jgi:hypothetical protein
MLCPSSSSSAAAAAAATQSFLSHSLPSKILSDLSIP